jgi:DNA polymerase-3 subunit delta
MAGRLEFDAAYRAIRRGELAPVYYLTGPEDVLKDELVTLIREEVLDPATRDFNVDVRAAADLDGERFHALVETPPMLAERRVVVVRNVEQWRKNARVWSVLDRYLANPSASTILVLVLGAGEKAHQELASRTVTVEVGSLSPERLRRWVQARAERAGLVLDEDAVEHLLHAVGPDLSHLAVEVEKLAAALLDGGRVRAADVAAMVGMRRGETPHDWVSAVLDRNITRAVEMLDVVLASGGVTGVRLVSLLGTTLVGIRVARAFLDEGSPSKRAGRAVFYAIRSARPPELRGRDWKREAAAWTAVAQRWHPMAIDNAIRMVYEADRQLKSTTVRDERAILTDMLLRIGGQKAAA